MLKICNYDLNNLCIFSILILCTYSFTITYLNILLNNINFTIHNLLYFYPWNIIYVLIFLTISIYILLLLLLSIIIILYIQPHKTYYDLE